jgi:hypothetical protein
MTELRASRREMERAFRNHKTVASAGDGLPYKLLLAYAIECGLKAELMRRAHVEEYHALPEEQRFGHDLRQALRLLRVPATLDIGTTRTRQREPQNVDSAKLHQAWRYGIECMDEEVILKNLQAILRWLEGTLQ